VASSFDRLPLEISALVKGIVERCTYFGFTGKIRIRRDGAAWVFVLRVAEMSKRELKRRSAEMRR
jgi:hypothetical protein